MKLFKTKKQKARERELKNEREREEQAREEKDLRLKLVLSGCYYDVLPHLFDYIQNGDPKSAFRAEEFRIKHCARQRDLRRKELI